MMKSCSIQFRRLAVLGLLAISFTSVAATREAHPNLVYILCDDLGYGDVRCMNPKGKIPTPNIDRLASQGMIFTDAHSSSAVCTPTRYGIMTGRYNWRSRLKNGVLGGMSPRLIEPGRLTVPALLKQHGYHTAAIGKWHLGMDWTLKPDAQPFGDNVEKGEEAWRVDFTKPIRHGPNSVGFDYFFGISASLDMVPYTFIENDRVVKAPSEDKSFPMVPGRTNSTTRKGPGAADFEAEDVLPTLTRKAMEYLEQRSDAAKRGQPFLLYLPLAAPHTPVAPTAEWHGKSGLNPYADFVMQVDADVGKILDALEKNGLTQNTLVIFASDNGCAPQVDITALRAKGHDPSGGFRDAKADIFEGGHRIPFIARWPGKIKAGSNNDSLISLNDLVATCAEIVGGKLPADAGEDSVSLLPALLGEISKPTRETLVHHSVNGSFAIREKNWKLVLCADSGGWSAPRPNSADAKELPAVQLYDLSRDIGETTNVQEQHPEVVSRLTKLLEKYVADGRSTPGAPQSNTGEVNIWRQRATADQPGTPKAK
jgi:arylsulfatase A-like enzyme